MRIALAQVGAIPGDIEGNVPIHEALARLAGTHGADLVVFPELSLTGYEPLRAAELATGPGDVRLRPLQRFCDLGDVAIGVGLPVGSEVGVHIAMLLLRPHRPVVTILKHYLHADEEPYFRPGDGSVPVAFGATRVAFAICYELSVPRHARRAAEAGAGLYLASVAKVADGAERAHASLAGIARRYRMPVLMVNAVGPCDGKMAGGRSATWASDGSLLGELGAADEGLLLFDTLTLATSVVRPT